jgi:predicted permease
LQAEALGAVLPVFIIAAIGYLAGRKLTLDVSTLSKTCLYILTPALTFNSLANSSVDLRSVWRLALAAFLVPLILAPVFLWLFRRLGWEANLSRSMLLPSIFSNTGNYGLPICLFAFGQLGMDLGVVYMVVQSFLIATLGVFTAASSKMEPKQALGKVIRMPTLYGALLGMTVKALEIEVPLVIARPVELLAQAAISVFLLVLGLQLVNSKLTHQWQIPGIATFARLILAPAFAALLGKLLGMNGLPWKILVLQAAMPPPVNATILAQEFDANPDLVSQTTLAGTVFSLVTLSGWILLLNRL